MNTTVKHELLQELRATRQYLNVIERKATIAKPDALAEWEGLIQRLEKRHAYLESLMDWETTETHVC